MDEPSFQGLWASPYDEELWKAYSMGLSDRLMVLTGILVLSHLVLRLFVSIMARGSSMSSELKETGPRLYLDVTHAVYCIVSGVATTWGPNSPLTPKLQLLRFSEDQAFVTAINISYSLCSCFLVITKSSSYGWRTVAMAIGKAAILGVMGYFNTLYPCLIGIKVWAWWNMTELGALAVAGARMVTMAKGWPKLKVTILMLGMFLTIGCVWASGYLVLWLHWWMNSNEMYDLPSEYPARGLTKTYLRVTIGAAVGWVLLSYMRFKKTLSVTKKWSQDMKAAKRSRNAVEQEETKKTT